MNSELTVAESFDSSWSLLQSLHINFLTSNSCECPHRLLDLIVKERDDRVVVGCASYAIPMRSQAHFTALLRGVSARLIPLGACSEECEPCRVSEAAL